MDRDAPWLWLFDTRVDNVSRLSLRVRLALGGLVALAVALGLAWAGLTLLFERHADRALASDLDEIVRQIIGGLEFDPSGAVALPHPPRDPRFESPLSGLYWEVLGAGKTLRSRSLWDTTLPLPDDALSEGQIHYHQVTGPDGKLLLVAEKTHCARCRARRSAKDCCGERSHTAPRGA